MKPVVERLAVVGLGLLGGSLALAAKRRGVARNVVGATRRADVRAEAVRRGAVDAVAQPAPAVRGADLVVLATPIAAMGDIVRALAPELAAGCVVSDVGSVKAPLGDTLPGLLPAGVEYVGAHPMAGSHESGFGAAREDLFDGATCVVMESGTAAARERVEAFWRGLGSRVVVRDPATHDAEVAWVSHAPHVLAYAFAAATGGAPGGAGALRGPGFRDFTRIARSDPELWADILTANRKALAAPLAATRRVLDEIEAALQAEDAETALRLLTAARDALAADFTRGAGGVDEREPPTAERSGGAGETTEE